MIHPTAIVSNHASIGENTEIGPYCIIGDNVQLGSNNKLHSNVVIQGQTTIGNKNVFFPFSAIGMTGQSYQQPHESPTLVIGDNNVFRENTTVHCSTRVDTTTYIGNHNLFLCYAHVAHDCQVGNYCTLSHNAGIAGFVTVEDHAVVSAMSGAHQFVRIGAYCITGGLSKIVKDIPPFMIADGNPAVLRGVNTIGLKRNGFTDDDINLIKTVYKQLFLDKSTSFSQTLLRLSKSEMTQNKHLKHLINFLTTSAAGRGVTH